MGRATGHWRWRWSGACRVDRRVDHDSDDELLAGLTVLGFAADEVEVAMAVEPEGGVAVVVLDDGVALVAVYIALSVNHQH